MLGTNRFVVAGETVTLGNEVMDKFLLGGFLGGVNYPARVFHFLLLLLNLCFTNKQIRGWP